MECDLYRKDIVCFKIPWLLFLEYLLVTEVGFDDFDILLLGCPCIMLMMSCAVIVFFLACRLFIGVCIRLCFCLLKMLLMNAMWIVVAKY
jgi:hypothetical protein